nr:Morn repeat incomplete domain containing protein [Pandoravirus aubagnensis]
MTDGDFVVGTVFAQCEPAHKDILGRDHVQTVDDKDEIIADNNDNSSNEQENDDDLLFYDDDDVQDGTLGEAHETSCRRAYVAAHGPGVPVFLMGARRRAGKDWAWLLAASSGDPARGQAAVGRVDYGPYRFYVGDVDARGLPDGYGAMVYTRTDAVVCVPDTKYEESAKTARYIPHSWPAPSALLKWHEGFWRAGQRQGEGVNVCLEYRVAMEGCWRDDLFDGYGVRVYGRGRWTLLPDGSGNGRWSGGDTWRHCGHWRGGERHGTGVLTGAEQAQPFRAIWLSGVVARDARESIHLAAPSSCPRP